MYEYSLIGVKPDAFSPDAEREAGSELSQPLPRNPEEFVREFQERLRAKAIRILTQKQSRIDAPLASRHYAEHIGVFDSNYGEYKHDFLVRYMTGWPSHFMAVYGDDAVRKGREALVEMREKYLVDRKKARYNMTHASDSPDGAKEEILLHFPEFRFIQPTDLIDPDSVSFAGFEGREDSLAGIYRYSNYPHSLYRSNLILHSRRVFFLLRHLLPEIIAHFPQVDTKRLQILCLVHDDTEILTGDHQSVNRLVMTPEQIAEIDGGEEKAIEQIWKIFPEKIEGYVYADLLRDIYEKTTLEAQIVKYLDHIDGHCEALHEIYAGNTCFVTPPKTEYGEVPIPPDYYIPRFANPEKYYPLITQIIGDTPPFTRNSERIDFETIAKLGVPHARDSLEKTTGYPMYDWWIRTLLDTGDQMVIEGLINLSNRIDW